MLMTALHNSGLSADIFGTPDQCLQGVCYRQYDLLLVDCDGDGSSALELVAQLQRMIRQMPTILFVEQGDVSTAVRAIRAGAADCVEKPIEMMRFISTLHAVLRQIRPKCPDSGMVLTNVEATVLHHILEGRTNRQIASLLCRSHRTVEVHRRHIMQKLGAATVVDLVKRMASLGISPAPGAGQEDLT
jgi:FixJ family two-component response regulator